jgi:hypothetical protein
LTEAVLGYRGAAALIHRDDLVVAARTPVALESLETADG